MELRLNDQTDKEIFRKMLRSGIVVFEYLKKDKSKRVSSGTLHPRTLKNRLGESFVENKPQGKNNATPTQITYWDLTVGGWRSPHLVGQTIKIKDIYPYTDRLTPSQKAERRIGDINTRLQDIYDQREEIKGSKKDYIRSSLVLKHKKVDVPSAYIDWIDKKLKEIEIKRKELRGEVKSLKEEKEQLQKNL